MADNSNINIPLQDDIINQSVEYKKKLILKCEFLKDF